jgi:two-component system, sensor histidine kinase and response regulator
MSLPDESSDGYAALDATRLLAKLGGDRDLLLEIAELFQRDAPAMLVGLREQVRGGDATDIAQAAHVLKGSAANFGLNPLYELAREIEHRARDRDLVGVGELMARLERAAEGFLAALQRLEREVPP